jgi:hypothetical protein
MKCFPPVALALALAFGPFGLANLTLTGAEKAAEIDRLLASETRGDAKGQIAKKCDDETFLRRASLDLVGKPPRLEEVLSFTLDPDANKREKLVDRLLADSKYGENWARYWRDVVMYRRTEERALISAQALADYLTSEFNKNTPWDKLATSFITALGDVAEEGHTGLIMAQAGQPEETVAEISRIFMGIQIQCAQCHDHPTDRWKREQFHELAAFFPRVAVRPGRPGDIRTFAVVADDGPARNFGNNNQRFRGSPEHYMPDLQKPGEKGKLMTPVFFATGQSLKTGTRDSDRRGQLAEWLTSSKNEWFAKAFVNRIWAELAGEGFYDPVDDMGPDRECSAPQTLDYLAASFVSSGHDVKQLYRTIMATDTYQRQSQSRRTPDGTPFLANCPQRLRGDQLFNQLMSVLGISEGGGGAMARGPMAFRGAQRGPRGLFNAAFGYDPSAHREEVAGSIPQALLMMNSPLVNQAIGVRGSSGLGRILADIKDNEAVVSELYLKTLSREPTAKEVQTCLAHVKQVSDRNEAFEDILWSLVNSTEFLHRK